jgi:hypothetical protein
MSDLSVLPPAGEVKPPGVLQLELLQLLLRDLQAGAISCCYWKSSRRLPAVLAGEADLDLLVAQENQHQAQRIMLDCGFKLFPSVAVRDHPAVTSWLGHDAASGRLVHLHVHAQLVVGGKLLKTHRLPLEQQVLAESAFHPELPIRLLDPPTEAVLLVLRGCVELRRRDPVTLRSWRALCEKFETDRAILSVQVDRGAVHRRAAQMFGAHLADDIVAALLDPMPLHRQTRRRRILRRLAPFRTSNALESGVRGCGRAAAWLLGHLNRRILLAPRPWNRGAPGGGRVIAVVGVDGSGKSTVVAALCDWLGTEVDVLPLYMGTGDGRASLLLWPLKLLVPAVSRLLGTKPRGASHGRLSGQSPGRLYAALLTLWASVLALEKRRKLLAAHRGAARGLVVITDRYPQDRIIGFNDGPLLDRLPRAPGVLRSFEQRAYALCNQLPPDLVIKLEATPEVLASREPNMDPTIIKERADQLRELDFPGARVARVDATRPLVEVIAAAKREVWRLL